MNRNLNNQKNRYFHYQKEILNTISEPATFIDTSYRYIFVNSAFNDFYKWETRDIIGNTVSTIWKDSVFGKHTLQSIKKCLKGENVFTQFEGMIPGVSFKIVEVHYYPHYNKAGKIDGVISTSKDVTEHKMAEQYLKENEAWLKELNETKDKLFSVIGHDLQGPLSNIIGFSELIEQDFEQHSTEDIRQYNRIIYQLSQSVSELLDNLLTWSRSHQNQIKISYRNLYLSYIIEKCHSMLAPNMSHKQIHYENLVPADTIASADEDMVTIVIRNLISNAIKFTKRGGKITVFRVNTEEKITIGIRDTGVGINPKKIPYMFKPGTHEGNTGTEGESGTGLGLVICKDFIEKNGGDIWIESEPGQGSVVYFSLPPAKDNHVEPEKDATGKMSRKV